MMIINNQDRFGFYQVGDLKFYNKTEAAIFAEKSNQKLTWIFNDAVYSSYNWTQEPAESLNELYRQRAQQLREKYDYLVLFLSGGADSSNILRAFVNHGIKLDEVASYMNYDGTKDTTSVLNGEVYHVVPQMIAQAREKQSWLKHTVIDLSPIIMRYYQDKNAKFDWMYDMNHYMNPNNIARQDIKLEVAEWRAMFDQGTRVGFIHGSDKPIVRGINGKYFFSFKDMVDGVVSARTQQLARPWEFDELFYWSPDAPKIVIKQAHAIKNFLKLHGKTLQGMSRTIIKKLHSDSADSIDKKLYWLTLDQLHTLIYPGWYPVPYQIKSRSLLFSDRDQWFFGIGDSETAKYSWRVGLEEAWRRAPDIIKANSQDISKGFRHVQSKLYQLD